ncbi:hypothetical protein HNQ96_005411 [Aminobacter lissarensis]|uniref:Uncharacterized protein n=1 Tax=Aminobacter carboxidus TaxID=376165 RepID=A0A8E2BE95_9HYPH|nr:hypothetical protein [Aminobacter lissarensis]
MQHRTADMRGALPPKLVGPGRFAMWLQVSPVPGSRWPKWQSGWTSLAWLSLCAGLAAAPAGAGSGGAACLHCRYHRFNADTLRRPHRSRPIASKFENQLEPNLEQFQENCAAVFRPELRKNKKIARFRDSKKSRNALERLPPRTASTTDNRRQRGVDSFVPIGLSCTYRYNERDSRSPCTVQATMD